MANPSDFLFNSDYQVDQVVYLKSLHFTMGAGSYGTGATVTHGLPFRPLPMGSWSTSSDFSSTVYEIGTEMRDSYGSVQVAVDVLANETSIQAIGTNNTDSSVTVYLNIFCLAPPDWSGGEIETTASDSNTFILSTDYNYCKLVKEDYIDVPQNTTVSVPHGMSTVPQALVWYVNTGGYVYQIPGSSLDGSSNASGSGDSWYYVDETNFTVINHSLITGSTRVYYRIYGD